MRVLLTLVLLLSLLPGNSFAALPKIDGDLLTDSYLKLTVTKPTTWRFLTPKEKRDRRTAVAYKNKSWGMMMRQETFPDRIVIAKYAEPYSGLNPTVTIDRYPLGEYRFKDGPWIAGYDSTQLRRIIFTPVIFKDGPRPSILAGKPAGYYSAYFDLEIVPTGKFQIHRQIWAISGGLSLIYVSATDAQTGPDSSRDEIHAIIDSLRFLD